VAKVRLHSNGDASRRAAWLLPQVLPDILGRHTLPAGRLAVLGATPDFHHGLLDSEPGSCTEEASMFTQVGLPQFGLIVLVLIVLIIYTQRHRL